MMLDDGSLAAGVAALLEARGEADLGALVRRSIVQVVGRAERWSMGARDVAAHRIALVVSAVDHVFVMSSPPRFAAIREAFATAVRSPETEMENLFLVLELPPTRTTFAQGYRDAPVRPYETPDAGSVLQGAAALCKALGDEASAQALSRASLEDSFVTANDRSVRRFVLRLDAADFALTEKNAAFGDRLMRAVRSAAMTPTEATSAVFLGVRLVHTDGRLEPETELVRALERKNVVVVPIVRDEQRTRFAIVYQEKLAVLEVEHETSRFSLFKSKSMVAKTGTIKVGEIRVSDQAMASVDAAEMASAEIVRDICEM
jgi:hypothetical protein